LGSFGQVIAYSASNIVAGSVATIFLIIFIKYEKDLESQNDIELFKQMISFGIPFYMKSLVITGLNQVYQMLMVIYVSAELIGNYGAAKNFGVLVSFLTIPIGTVLFPLFSKYNKNDPQIRTLYFKSVKYTTIVTLPIIFCLILVSNPLGEILFGSGYSYVPLFLSLFILSYSFEGLGGTTQEYLILGIGEARVSFIAGIITFIAGTILSFILIPQYQIFGLLVSYMIAPRAGWVYSTLWLQKNLGFTADWKNSLRIYASAFSAFTISFLILQLLNLKSLIMLIVGSGFFFSLYIFALPIFQVLDHGALRELNEVCNIFGPFAWIPKTLISWINRFAK
jgi:teichuronic acid exporter